MVRPLLSVCVLLIGLAALVPAADTKKEAPKSEEKVPTLESKAEPYASAAAIDFGASLGLAFPTLTTLGGRIEAARRQADPVGLAAAASELTALEKVAGKKAALTGEALSKEAVTLVELRGKSSELEAVALLVSEGAVSKKLTKLAKKAATDEANDAKALELGQKTRGIQGQLVVHNHFPHHVRVFVNGNFVGQVHGRCREHFHIRTHGGETRLRAEGGGLHWHNHVHGNYGRYEWTLSR